MVEGVTLYYHNQETNTRAHHHAWNQALNLEENANMTFPENVPMAKMISPMDSWDLSTPKTYIKHMHLLGASELKLRRKNYIESNHSE